MSGRDMGFFAPPIEAIELLAQQCDRLGLVATVYEPPLNTDRPGRTGTLHQLPVRWDAPRLMPMPILLHAPGEVALESWSDLNPAERGWVVVWLGRQQRDADRCWLEQSTIAAKSDYLAGDIIQNNPRSLEIWTRVTRPLKRRLCHPMIVRNIVYGGERLYPIYYSEQAEAMATQGCELIQRGVANVRFFPLLGDSKD